MKIRLSILLFTLLFISDPCLLPVWAGSRLVHYSVEDGLPHNRVSFTYQDSKGFIWLATQNGAARFDGYEFTTFLSGSSDTYRVRDSRVTRIAEDGHGYIWLITHSGDIHRLDPATDSIVNIGEHLRTGNRPFGASRIKITPSGTVWLISEKDGCVGIKDPSLHYEWYSTDNGRLKGDTFSYIHEDREQNTWLLTDNGLAMIRAGENTPTIFFEGNETTRQAFHSILEWTDKLWFGTDNGCIWSYTKKSEKFELIGTGINSSVIHLIHGENGQALIGTSGDGILIHDSRDGQTEHYHTGNSGLADDRILSLFIDPWANIWIQVPVSGIARFDPQEKQIVHYHTAPPDENEYASAGGFIRMDPENRLWMRPRDGVFSLYDPQLKTLTPYNQTPFSPSPDYPENLFSAYFDRQGNLWICPDTKGLDKITFPKNNFRTVCPAGPGSSRENDVRALLEDRNGLLWVSTKEGKVHLLDRSGASTGYLCSDGTVGKGTPLKGVTYCLFEEADGTVWIGTKGDGLYRLAPDGPRYRIRHYVNRPDDLYSLNNNSIYSLRGDSAGRLWIGTWGGGLNLLEKNSGGEERFIHHHNQLKGYPIDRTAHVRHISEEKAGKIYVGTTRGLLVFDTDYESPDRIRFRHYGQEGDPEESLTHNDIQHICHGTSGTYLATAGGGIDRVTARDGAGFPERFKAYTRQDGLSSDVILSLLEARDSSLWIVSEENIMRFDPASETFRTFDEARGLIRSELFSEGSAALLRSGMIFQGFSGGLLFFHPGDIGNSTFIPRISFTHFLLFNKEVTVGGNSPLPKHIDEVQKITLTHRDRIFSIGFAALDFDAPENIRYSYRLEGFDREWIYAHKQRTAGYMNLPKGEYTLRVRSTNADGTWVENERRLLIEMLPPFWETGWAFLLYGLLLIGLIVAGAYILHTIFRLKNQVRLEAQLAEMKLRFFTDISHEIRTPLTLITAPVEHLLHDRGTPEPVKKQLDFVSQNTRRMLRMVNQILDLRKAQHGPLRIEAFGIGALAGTVCRNFEALAREQQIDFHFEDRTDGTLVWADRDGLEKIVFNLLSNAFKYTPAGKSIRVRLENETEGFRLEVRDEGKGIEPCSQPLIFHRFYTAAGGESQPSSGIGLSMVKELVDKHKGTIRVESTPGAGSTFTVFFRKGYAHYGKEADWIVPSGTASEESAEEEARETADGLSPEQASCSVLLVEDDKDLRSFLCSILSADYRIWQAKDGREGLYMAMKYAPDLIVSDIMMPDIDGIGLLKELRSNLSTCHIPVVLLTAKGEIEDKLEGLEFGADDYLVKPFSVPYFRARIRNLLNQRKQLQDLYYSDFISSNPLYDFGKSGIAVLDREFLDLLVREVEKHLDDSEYSIEELVKITGLSRTVFFKKTKALTGMAPVEFVREVKLQHAARLLKTKQLMVKEVSYLVGFNDLKYFSQCFKARFGVTPSKFRENPTDLS